MARKTFIKVRIGILEPKHIFQIGGAIWLYLYILNRADWKTGKIFDWRDKDAAAEIGVYVQSIRNQRKRLESGEYITSMQRQHRLEITVSNWHDPASKVDQQDQDFVGDKKIAPPSIPQGDSHGDTHDDSHGDRNLSSLLFNQELRNKKKEDMDNSENLLSRFVEISKVAYVPRNLTDLDEWNVILRRLHNAGVTDEIMARACEGRNITHPAQILSDCSKLLQTQ